jgi:hypothetical protein
MTPLGERRSQALAWRMLGTPHERYAPDGHRKSRREREQRNINLIWIHDPHGIAGVAIRRVIRRAVNSTTKPTHRIPRLTLDAFGYVFPTSPKT